LNLVHTRYSVALIVVSMAIGGCGGSSSSDSTEPIITLPPVNPPNFNVVVFERPDFDGQECSYSGAINELQDTFIEIADEVGLDYSHEMSNGDNFFGQSGGVAAGDYNNDGWIDLYAIGGDDRPNLLLANSADGVFIDRAIEAGLDLIGKGSGPAFADFDGDGDLDLFIGSVDDGVTKLFINAGDGKFTDITTESNLDLPGNNVSAAWGDYDQDEDLDLLISHWTLEERDGDRFLWRNNGDLTFTNVSVETNLGWGSIGDLSFSPGFADINNDGASDVLFVADGVTSAVFLNQPDLGVFEDITDEQISDRSGMGSAIADYDNDGDLDWFVSSISRGTLDRNRIFGNRLYENQGQGYFIDVSESAGVREGHWGWGSCFSDFDNDGNQDIFHVNGFSGQSNFFLTDPSVLFMSNGDGTFSEKALKMGIDDTSMGRGVVCFDYDRDGDQDIFIANYDQPPKLYCNYGNDNGFINIKLIGKQPNTEALGARVYVTTGNLVQMRELNANSNYVSQNPAEAHFGLADVGFINEIKIVWPNGDESIIEDVDINQFLRIEKL
jgi:hypothetical protein